MNTQTTAQYIIELAKEHNVSYDKDSELSKLAKKMIELSDDEYLLDDIDQLVVALMKKKVITSREGISLISKYNKELAQSE